MKISIGKIRQIVERTIIEAKARKIVVPKWQNRITKWQYLKNFIPKDFGDVRFALLYMYFNGGLVSRKQLTNAMHDSIGHGPRNFLDSYLRSHRITTDKASVDDSKFFLMTDERPARFSLTSAGKFAARKLLKKLNLVPSMFEYFRKEFPTNDLFDFAYWYMYDALPNISVRNKLENDTGYSQINTFDEIYDASKMIKPGSEFFDLVDIMISVVGL